VTYQEARSALEKCSHLDECQKWADKAKALASYAKQADDDTLCVLATRIKARAIRRCGQLLNEIEAKDGRPKNCMGAHTVNRSEAAETAGLSRNQKVTALRVANVPEQEFEAAVESDNPPTITELARIGTRPSLVERGTVAQFAAATDVLGAIHKLAGSLSGVGAEHIAAGVQEFESETARADAVAVCAWLTDFIKSLGG
jgi:hypothetical protein